MKKHVFTLMLSIMSLCTYAQQLYNQNKYFLNANSNWIWGEDVYLKNSEGKLSFDISAPATGRMSEHVYAVASDPHTGALLFYTDGYNIYDAQHNVMPNGGSMIVKNSPYTGNPKPPGSGSPWIVPVPGEEGRYYVFLLIHSAMRGPGFPIASDPNYNQLVYSIVDMSLNEGQGGVEPASKETGVANIIPDGDTAKVVRDNYSLMAIPGDNCDYWLVSTATSNDYNRRYFVLNRITENGVEAGILKEIDAKNKFTTPGGGYYLMHSPDRKKIFVGNPLMYIPKQVELDSSLAQVIGMTHDLTSELYDFNPINGDIGKRVKIGWINDTANGWMFGCYSNVYNAFSPDSRYLYSIQTNFYASQVYINQYDISSMDSATIWNSVEVLDSVGSFQGSGKMFGCVGVEIPCLKQYDDKVYMTWGAKDYLGAINEPNKKGNDSEVDLFYYMYPSARFNTGIRGFNEVSYPMMPDRKLVAEYEECESYILKPRFSDPDIEYVWNDGTTGMEKIAERKGKYWVSYSILKDNCLISYTDTFVLNFAAGVEPPLIRVNGRILSTSPANYAYYQWFLNGEAIPGANSATYTVLENGFYSVEVKSSEGCYIISEEYQVSNLLNIRQVTAANINLYPNPASNELFIESDALIAVQLVDLNGRIVLMSQGENQQLVLSNLATGVYLVRFFDLNGNNIGSTKIVKE